MGSDEYRRAKESFRERTRNISKLAQDRYFDIGKQRAAFFDRLIILDGATITVALTAASNISNKHPVQDVGALRRACLLFVTSVVSSLFVNFLIPLLYRDATEMWHSQDHASNYELAAIELPEIGGREYGYDPAKTIKTAEEYKKIGQTKEKYLERNSMTVLVLSLIAQFSTIAGFVELYRFIAANF